MDQENITMVFSIQEISTDKGSGHTYVLVHFWSSDEAKTRGDAPSLVNEFLMRLRPTGERKVRDESGRFQLTTGEFVDPSEILVEKSVDVLDQVTREKIGERNVFRTREDLPT